MLIKEILETFNRDFVFQNSIGRFEAPRSLAKYSFLKQKYGEMGKEVAKNYTKVFSDCSSCSDFIERHDEYFSVFINVGLNEVKKDLMSVGIFDLDEKAIYEYMDKSEYLNVYKKVNSNFMDTVDVIYEDLEYKKAVREERKDNRARWVGGTFSSRPNYIDQYMHQVELGARNAIEGAGHSLINAVGNAASKASANAQLENIYKDEETRYQFQYGVERAVANMHFAVKYFLENRLGIDEWKVPTKDECIRAKRLRNNFSSSGLTEEQRKSLLVQSFNLNPFNKELYSIMLGNYPNESKSITEIAKFFGVNLDYEKDKIALDFLSSRVGNTEEQAKRAKEELLKFYQQIGVEKYQELESYKQIQKILDEYDLKFRTVDNEVFATREEAELARKELPEIMEIMKKISPPTINSTLEYEADLLKIKEDFQNRFSSGLKTKYLTKIDKYLADFEFKFCKISMFKSGTRKEAAKVKALNFVKQQKTDTAIDRETALDNLRRYLPKIGLSEQEATEALEYLKKKEHEELYGKESVISKLGKSLGDLFK